MSEDQPTDEQSDSQLEPHEDGRREYPEREFLEAVENIGNPTTGDIAREVGCQSQTALYRLNKLEDEKKVSGTMIGRAKVWSVDD